MDTRHTAVILIGFQNDYFAPEGALHGVVHHQAQSVLDNTLRLVDALPSDVLVLATPIVFQPGYPEMEEPVGILKLIRERGAFAAGQPGCDTIEPLLQRAPRVRVVPGKRGFNAFHGTSLLQVLRENSISQVLLAGVVTSICIDSTARYAADQGYKVGVLSDCTAGRNATEQSVFCDSLFPMYASVLTADEALEALAPTESLAR
ncbi:cysteine hydrolase family protein [Amphibiibacter pelophylacis]|uniref:Cysteine hydrolase n=1 Tax=Amphibiibacter pelophylacis TaxID=1799477 RepID=A0ACC6P6U3_9BURK